ncbi:hypothetical protein N9E34_04795 [Opitutales bacterium]|nr:hypothetical protein [Opitutales bacterium]
MAGIKDYSTTQANNTSLNGISTAEGMLPSNLNNAIRALMKNTRDFYNDAQWVEYGDGSGSYTAAYVSGTSFTINGADVTSEYHAGRRIKIYLATTAAFRYGVIASSSFSTNTTVNVTWDSGSLANETLSVYLAILTKTNSSIPTEIIGTSNIADGAVTTAKIAADAVNGSKIADDSINSEHYVDGSIDTAHIADSQITDAKLATDSVTTVKITDANVTTAKIAADAITNAKIADDSIDSEQYVDGSIDTAHIADSQITTAKLADNSVTSAKIVDGSIVNADVNASAAIDATKIHDGTISNTEFGYLNGVSSAIQTQLDAKLTASNNLSDLGAASTARTNLGLGTIAIQDANNVSISGGAVTGLGSPSASSDAATKNYVDQAVAGLRTRTIAECASTGNVNITNGLEAGDSIDGVTLVAGDRVLLKDQTDATENGLYLAVSSGAASRDPEHDSIAELSGGMVVVNQGSTNDNKIFLCTTDNTGSVGSTNITYTVITPSNVGTVTSVGVADSGSSEFTVANSPITSSGTITLAVNSIANTKITGLGTSSTLNVGTSANNVVQLDGSAKLPAVDGSQLTNIDAASAGFAIAMAIAL